MNLVTQMNVQQYIDQFPPIPQKRLQEIYRLLKKYFPHAQESFAYQMPTFKAQKNFFHFAGYAHHIGIYPGPQGVEYLLSIAPESLTSKGAWRIPHEDPFPRSTLIQFLQWIKIQNR